MTGLRSRPRRVATAVRVSVLCVAVGATNAYALRTTQLPADLQTENTAPVKRRLSLKLPLRQAVFHWTFDRRADLLSGKLVLHIDRGGGSTSVTIFENGEFAPGWEAIDLPNPEAGEVYFGFQSSEGYATAPGDRLRLELLVEKDLPGVGPTARGTLPAGVYTAEGSYSGLIDEYAAPFDKGSLPEAAVAKIREAYEYKAFLENWDQQWSLTITSEEGWLPPAERARLDLMLKRMAEEDAAARDD